MKTLAFIISFIVGNAMSNAQVITVTVDNVLNNNGKVLFALHTEDTFMKGAGVQNGISEIEDGKAKIRFEDVEPGTYAIMVLHDENNNQRMDFREDGMPKEYYGVSNNNLTFGPPVFANAKFEFGTEDKHIEISFRF